MVAPRILIVDDDKYALDTILTIVKRLGYRVKGVSNGEAALKVLKKEKFSLVLLDVLMPGVGGEQVLKEIRAMPKLKELKVVLLTVIKLADVGISVGGVKNVYYVDKASGVVGLKKALKRILKK